MPVPTAYTETTLADFMATQLGNFPALFGWTSPASYQEAVNETLFSYGVTAITSATNIRKLRALARVEAGKLVISELASKYKFQADGSSFEQQQMHEMASKNLAAAERDAMPYTTDYSASVGVIGWTEDPYRYPPDEE
jgi:hypothetical protein